MKTLKLAADLSLPAESVTETFGILAARGAGKSNLAAVLAEQMFDAGLPFVVIDPVGAWYGLRAGADGGKNGGLSIPIFGGPHGDVPLERQGGELIADLVVSKRLSCVLDLTGFDSEAAKKGFLLDFARRLYQKNQDPLHLFLEEADDYIPQRPMRDEAQLLRAWENIVRRGRSRGLGMTLITQRSASVNKSVLTQVQTLFVLRTTGPQDRAAIEAWVKYHDTDATVLASLSGLASGQGWVWSPQFLGRMSKHQFTRRRTFDSGATPKNLRGKDARPAATLADVDLGVIQQQMTATIERAKADDPKELRKLLAQASKDAAASAKKINDLEARVSLTSGSSNSDERAKQEAPVLTDADRERLDSLLTVTRQLLEDRTPLLQGVANSALSLIDGALAEALEDQRLARQDFSDLLKRTGVHRVLEKLDRVTGNNSGIISTPNRTSPVASRPAQANPKPAPIRQPARAVTASVTPSVNGIVPAQAKILGWLSWLAGVGFAAPSKTQLALWCAVSPTSGGYFNNLGKLRSSGLIDYPSGGTVALTDAGTSVADAYRPDLPADPAAVQENVCRLVGQAKAAIVRELVRIYPADISKDDLAQRIGVSPTSGGYFNNLGALRTYGVIDYPRPGFARAEPVLFLEEGR